MAWLVCGIYGEEFIFDCKPHRTCVCASNDEEIEYWEGYREDLLQTNQLNFREVV